MSDYASASAQVQANREQAAQSVSAQLRDRLVAFVSPLAEELDRRMDVRLVRTFQSALESILRLRNRANGLLLSELGGVLAGPSSAPAGTKRLSNLLRSKKWKAWLVERFLWRVADARLEEMAAAEQEAVLLWDGSVQEKVESRKAEGLCPVRSSKAGRCLKVKPGFYQPPTHKPVFVPGLHWLALLLMPLKGRASAPAVACMRWWTRRGGQTVKAQREGVIWSRLLKKVADRWGGRVLHVFDRGFCGGPWIGALLGYGVRFAVRFRKDWHLRKVYPQAPAGQAPAGQAPIAQTTQEDRPRPQAAWKISRGKRSMDKRRVWNARTRSDREQGVLWFAVEHPSYPGQALWLVVSRPGKGQAPWYLLTNEPVQTAEDAWKVVFAYSRRWQIEQCFRYNKSELAMESPRLWTWERRIKLLLLVTLCYAFLLSLLEPMLRWLIECALRAGCHRTGKRSRETSAPLYRIRAAISQLWTYFTPLPTLSNAIHTQSSG